MKRAILLLAALMLTTKLGCANHETPSGGNSLNPPMAAEVNSPKWVLYDYDNNPVEALVLGSSMLTPDSTRFQPIATIEQGYVIAVGSRLVNLDFDFVTGEIIPSAEYTAAEWAELSHIKYMTNTCDGDGFFMCSATNSTSSYDKVSSVISIDDVLYYADHGDQVLQPGTVYSKVGDGACQPHTPVSGTKYCNYRQVPEEIVNILPNPPYRLRLEYN